MIYCHIMGGLGNQLFQIFATMAYAIQYNQPFAIFVGYEQHGPRRTHWNDFLVDLAPFTVASIPRPTYCEDWYGFDYHPIPYLGEMGSLHGYFQSELYFRDHFEMICQNSGIREKQEEVRQKYLAEYFVKEGVYISMHFRLGDYKQQSDNHPVIGYDYYYKALCKMSSDLGNMQLESGTVLYFCEEEDNDVVKSMVDQLKSEFPGLTFCKVADYMINWEQMMLMSFCHHHIIANSSFSWWGAYFNKRSDKIVCYPSQWFGPSSAHLSTKDICPSGWRKIE